MDLPVNLNRPPVDQDPIYEEVLAAFTDDLSETELLKLFIKYSYHMYVDEYANIQRVKHNMQNIYATQLLPNVLKHLHTALQKPNNANSLLTYRRERIGLLNELFTPLAKPRFNQIFFKKVRRGDPWGKDSILDGEELTFVGVAANDGGPSSSGVEGVAQVDEAGGD